MYEAISLGCPSIMLRGRECVRARDPPRLRSFTGQYAALQVLDEEAHSGRV